ncbi:ribonuclease Z [Haloarchaeobius amylolyticus]|uniref:ribonuclease Z n=1 Tax=Haloarchaeobius amylolyticus TaxID=1198296 RepID=UPI002270FFCA|nr:ribonuclease Z [Haloarchaeobius amylolyticus]
MSLRVTFLGTSGAVPTTQRNPSAIYCQREGEGFLFDCAEGTQRQMMRFGTGFGIDHLFVTHTHGDHVLGIPGLMQTMDFNDREDALAIHCPAGERRVVEGLLRATGNRPSFPVRVHEVTPGDVALDRDEYEIRVFDVEHRTNAVGYALVEDDRKGRFDREHAEELGVPVGPKFSKLHEGNPVELEDGTVVHPEQVVGDPRPGRRFVYTGDTEPVAATAEVAANADLLVHDATFAEDGRERAGETGHSTAKQAAELARRAGVKRLALTHISSRYANDVSAHEEEASEVFDGEVFVPDDGDTVEIPYPDGE